MRCEQGYTPLYKYKKNSNKQKAELCIMLYEKVHWIDNFFNHENENLEDKEERFHNCFKNYYKTND